MTEKPYSRINPETRLGQAAYLITPEARQVRRSGYSFRNAGRSESGVTQLAFELARSQAEAGACLHVQPLGYVRLK